MAGGRVGCITPRSSVICTGSLLYRGTALFFDRNAALLHIQEVFSHIFLIKIQHIKKPPPKSALRTVIFFDVKQYSPIFFVSSPGITDIMEGLNGPLAPIAPWGFIEGVKGFMYVEPSVVSVEGLQPS